MCHSISLFVLLIGSAAFSADQPKVADLQPELREALVRDATCNKSQQVAVADPEKQLLEAPVVAQEIRISGRPAGMILEPQDSCHCHGENCSTYVYVKQAGIYRLALAARFASLHPMRIIKHGIPSLTGKLRVNDSQAETTVYDWNGKEYQPSLCATITQHKNRKLPSIATHQCTRAPQLPETPQTAAVRTGS